MWWKRGRGGNGRLKGPLARRSSCSGLGGWGLGGVRLVGLCLLGNEHTSYCVLWLVRQSAARPGVWYQLTGDWRKHQLFSFHCLIGCLYIPFACLSVCLSASLPGRKPAFNLNALMTHESTYKVAKLDKKQYAYHSLSAQDRAWVFPLPYFTTFYGNCTYEGGTSCKSCGLTTAGWCWDLRPLWL